MVITINNKDFTGEYISDGKLIIHLNDNSDDILYFQEWINKFEGKTILKKDVVQDLNYRYVLKSGSLIEQGILRNCLPIFDLNKNTIQLTYDWKEYR